MTEVNTVVPHWIESPLFLGIISEFVSKGCPAVFDPPYRHTYSKFQSDSVVGCQLKLQ